jgi:hypothetical protein
MIRVGRGRSAITIDGPLADGLERELREVLGPVVDRMQAEADRIMSSAQKEWPVKTGESRAAFDTVLTVNPGSFKVEVSVVNRATYTKYIKSTKQGKRRDATRLRSPLQTLVAKPAREATKMLRKELPGVLAKALNNSLEG